jgi:hypothetical protein
MLDAIETLKNAVYDKYKKKEEEVRKQAELKKQQLERDLEK